MREDRGIEMIGTIREMRENCPQGEIQERERERDREGLGEHGLVENIINCLGDDLSLQMPAKHQARHRPPAMAGGMGRQASTAVCHPPRE